ncbi:hypothetical protein TREES_T100017511 [Tupaia chinensis]|uniref:Uncharacterized protein n=1 Tax=Tupaia chinensis TaxID=246437 RepID=L9LDH1_TUPCH|nr:hypothetical protein TREES_T100017511 [Tupaia chinensis]
MGPLEKTVLWKSPLLQARAAAILVQEAQPHSSGSLALPTTRAHGGSPGHPAASAVGSHSPGLSEPNAVVAVDALLSDVKEMGHLSGRGVLSVRLLQFVVGLRGSSPQLSAPREGTGSYPPVASAVAGRALTRRRRRRRLG